MVVVASTTGVEETEAVAARLAMCLRAVMERGEASTILVGLIGSMGAGKTAFVRGFVEALPGGLAAAVSSPTYAIAQPYPTDPTVFHMDLYRLDSVEEFEAIGGPQLLSSEGLVVVEWADRLMGLPHPDPQGGAGQDSVEPWFRADDWLEVRLTERLEDQRSISIRPHGAGAERWIAGAHIA